jgi:predicted PurR-regulated permease PerM
MTILILVLSLILNVFLIICILKSFSTIDKLEEWILKFKYQIEDLYNYLTYIDDKNMFEKDDEVGYLFEQIRTAISSTKEIILDEDDEIENN